MAAIHRTRNKHPRVESPADGSEASSPPHDFSRHDLRFENLIESAPGAIVVIDAAAMRQIGMYWALFNQPPVG